jgi:hypothetical protein
LRAVLILIGLLSGPAWLIAGSVLAGRPPEGSEWLDTVLLVPSISLVAAGGVAGFFYALRTIQGLFEAIGK